MIRTMRRTIIALASARICSSSVRPTLAVVGGGAAGFFGAIEAASVAGSNLQVIILESGPAPLRKVKISGGGRCNVMHDVEKPVRDIVQGYPRGNRQLLGPMTSLFGPEDTFKWFSDRGVKLKIEKDGRMFPITDSSQTVIDCLADAAKKASVSMLTGAKVCKIHRCSDGVYSIDIQGSKLLAHSSLKNIEGKEKSYTLQADFVLLATGSSREGYKWAEELGHDISAPVPSLFTLTIPDSRLDGLAGVSVQDAEITLEASPTIVKDQNGNSKNPKKINRLTQRGPVLITHSGISGPAVLKLSAFGARELQIGGYKGVLCVNWTPSTAKSVPEVMKLFLKLRTSLSRKEVSTFCPLEEANLPRRLWKVLVDHSGIGTDEKWGGCSNSKLLELANNIIACKLSVTGKGTFKEEFVTCGGVVLDSLDMKTMESRHSPGVHFAGEIIDVDGITGGYNFQSAWTTGWCAGHSIGKSAVQRQNEK